MCLDGWSPLFGVLCRYCSGHRTSNKTAKLVDYSKKTFGAWYMDDSQENMRSEHHRSPPQFIDAQTLYKLTGVEHFKFDLNSKGKEWETLLKKRGAVHEGVVVSPDKDSTEEYTLEYEEKLRKFFTEHLHDEDEIRFCIEGAAYFDIRDKNDDWIRIRIGPGDMLIIPSGVYHRSSPTESKDQIRVRTFDRVPSWSSYTRPADDVDCRLAYLKRQEKEFEE